MTWKLYALLSGGAFVATYLVSGPGALTTVRPAPRAAAARPVQANVEIDMQQLADHLAARVHGEVNFHQPTRNPFAFGAAPHAANQVIAPKVVEAPPAVFVPPPPPFTLSGIATDRINGELRRTAILSSPNGVLLAREGDAVGERYRVVSIDENAVTLSAVSDGSAVRLALSKP
jgi:hypothetical protein